MKTVQAGALGSLAIVAVIVLLIAGTARADDVAFGPRVGYTHDSHFDQIHFGGQVAWRNISSNLHVVPSLELGLGDGSLLALNGDVVWEFTELASGGWSYYAGGGPLLSHFKKNNRSSTDFALSLVGGFTREIRDDRAWFGEVRLGLEDAPVLKLTVGLLFDQRGPVMNENPAVWRDRDRLLPLLGRWRALVCGRRLHRVTTGGDWTSLQLRGDDRPSLLLGALPAGVLAFPYTAPLPAALHAALRPVVRNPLVGLLAGAQVTEVALLAGDLVLHLTLVTDGGPRLLRHQLFGSRGGTVVLEPGGRVLWSAHASPHPCLLDPTAALTVPAPTNTDDDDLAAWSTAGLLHLARQQATALADRLQRTLERRLGAATRLVANLEVDLARAEGGQEQRRDAEALASYLHLAVRGADQLTCPDPHGGPDRTIALDPSASAAANLERLFRLARKAERGRQVIADRLADARAASAQLVATQAELTALLSDAVPLADLDQALARLADLQAFTARHGELLRETRTQGPGRAAEEPARPFRRFLIGGRWEVWVGRSSQENDELTHRASSPRDLWLHAQGVEGSHVILRTGGQPTAVPRAVLEQAAALAAVYSKARHSSLVPVLWTERRYVRRPRRTAPGTAVCLRAESVMVEPGIGAGVEPA